MAKGFKDFLRDQVNLHASIEKIAETHDMTKGPHDRFWRISGIRYDLVDNLFDKIAIDVRHLNESLNYRYQADHPNVNIIEWRANNGKDWILLSKWYAKGHWNIDLEAGRHD